MMEIKFEDGMGGASCKTCGKWDGRCTHPRHVNDDPQRPCLLYRYRAQEEVTVVREDETSPRQCARCRKFHPADDYRRKHGGFYRTCRMCRKANQEKMKRREARKKGTDGHDA